MEEVGIVLDGVIATGVQGEMFVAGGGCDGEENDALYEMETFRLMVGSSFSLRGPFLMASVEVQ